MPLASTNKTSAPVAGEAGSVTWMFDKKGLIIINSIEALEEEILNKIIDLDIEEFTNDGELYIIETKPNKVFQIGEIIKSYGYKI